MPTKRFFEKELEQFRSSLILMGELAFDAVCNASRALLERDVALAKQVRENDDRLDQLEVEIDAEAVRYISLRAPVASDLRLLMVGSKVGHDLERVGDEASSIAKRVDRLVSVTMRDFCPNLVQMSELVAVILKKAMDCFLEGNEEKAMEVCRSDKPIDTLHREIYQEMASRIAGGGSQGMDALNVVLVAKSLERIGDHAVNLAEETVYLLRGLDIRHTWKH